MIDEQWKELFSLFGYPNGGFDPGSSSNVESIHQLMQNRREEMGLEGPAAEAFAIYERNQEELRSLVALENFKAGIFFAQWLSGSTFFHVF